MFGREPDNSYGPHQLNYPHEMEEENAKALIDPDFFGKGITVDVNRIFPVLVMATMSSGKSTFINALLGEEILPAKNEACTSTIIPILNDDTAEETILYLTDVDGRIMEVRNEIAEQLERANNTDRIKNILLSGNIMGLQNTKKSLLLIDSPGPNNYRDDYLKKFIRIKGGMILYVLNATFLYSSDECGFLRNVSRYFNFEKGSKWEIIFVLNKIDMLDGETESVSDYVEQVKEFLESCGFKEPRIIPASSLAALLMKKGMRGGELTRRQQRSFENMVDIFNSVEPEEPDSGTHVNGDLPELQREIKVGYDTYTIMQLENALENTGIPYIERIILEHLGVKESARPAQDEEKVTELFMSYEPRTRKYAYEKNGKPINRNTRLMGQQYKRLQDILEPNDDNWEGIDTEIRKFCNDSRIKVIFSGSRMDFETLKYCLENSGEAEFMLEFRG